MSLPWTEDNGFLYYPNCQLDQSNVIVYPAQRHQDPSWRVYKKSDVWRCGKADTVEEAKRQAVVAWVELCLTEEAS